MTFVTYFSTCEKPTVDKNVIQVVENHSAKNSSALVLKGDSFWSASVGSVKIAAYKYETLVLLVGKPRFIGETNAGLSLTDIVYNLYQKLNERLIEKVFGSFGIIILDCKKKQCLTFRDRIGFVPLFYCIGEKGIWLSNSIKPIIASRCRTFSLDYSAIYRYLFLKAFESPDTPIREIRSLEPACSLSFNKNNMTTRRYWDIPVATRQFTNKDEQVVATELQSLLQEIVYENLKSVESTNGFLLSGGLDSSILVALLAKSNILRSKSTAINVTFTGDLKALDESLYAERTANSSGIPLHKVEFSLSNFLKILPVLFSNNNLPTANSGLKLSLVCSQIYSNNISTFILGEGADTLLGYSWKWKYFNQLYKATHLSKVFPENINIVLLRFFEELTYTLQSTILRNRYLGFFNSYFGTLLGYWKWKGSKIRAREVSQLFCDSLRPVLVSELIRKVFAAYYNQIKDGTLAEKLIYATLKSYMPNQQLMNYQTICNFYDADLFCPYLDERIMDYCLQLPVSLRQGKRVLKTIATNLVPSEVITREKQVFRVPMEVWLKGQLKPLVDIAFLKNGIKERGIFDPQQMTKLYEVFFQEKFQSWSDIWSFVVLEAWLRINWDTTIPKKSVHLQDIFPEVTNIL